MGNWFWCYRNFKSNDSVVTVFYDDAGEYEITLTQPNGLAEKKMIKVFDNQKSYDEYINYINSQRGQILGNSRQDPRKFKFNTPKDSYIFSNSKYSKNDSIEFSVLDDINAVLDTAIYLYNKGKNFRDYTHIDDVVTIIDKLIKKKIKNKFEIFNICSNKPIDIYKLSIFISKILKTKPRLIFKKRNKIEVIKTHGSNKKILNFLGYKIKKNIFKEIPEIINWYKENKIWKYKE